MMKRAFTTTLAFALALGGLAACTDDTTAPTGIYQATDTHLSGSCASRATDQSFVAALARTPDAINLAYRDGQSTVRQELVAPTYEKEFTEALACTGATRTVRLGLIEESGGEVHVEKNETWQGVTGCPVDPAAPLPSSDCTSSRVLTYTLLEACEEPCNVVAGVTPDELRCECPQ